MTETLPKLQCDVDPLQLQKFEQLKWNISPESEADIERAKVNVSKWVTMAMARGALCMPIPPKPLVYINTIRHIVYYSTQI